MAALSPMALLELGRDSGSVDDPIILPSTTLTNGGTAQNSTDSETENACALLQEGNAAFRFQHYDEAINVYSRAMTTPTSLLFLLLSNRCAAFCSLSKRLREIPAAQSEGSALYGLDPMALSQLAVRDADKLLKLVRGWPKAHYRRACALHQMEQYDAARIAYFEGLHLDPTNKLLQEGLKTLDAEDEREGGTSTSRLNRSGKFSQIDELECSLCLKLLYIPVTTPCGHTFCRACLVRALDHSNKCPVCRVVLFVSAKSYPVSVTLQNILERYFPEEYAERKTEMEAVSLSGREILPMFVMDVVLPGQKMALNIFEPRYRLMVRRCMEGDHKMGMVGIDSVTRKPADVACEVEICECEPLPDGRFYLEVEGRRRCRIVGSWEQDGYRVGQVEWLEDNPVEADSPDAAQVQALATIAVDLARTRMAQAQENLRSGRQGRLADLLRQAGDMPACTQPERLSFWLANLLPMRSEEKLKLLRSVDTKERLNRAVEILKTEPQYCRLQ